MFRKEDFVTYIWLGAADSLLRQETEQFDAGLAAICEIMVEYLNCD